MNNVDGPQIAEISNGRSACRAHVLLADPNAPRIDDLEEPLQNGAVRPVGRGAVCVKVDYDVGLLEGFVVRCRKIVKAREMPTTAELTWLTTGSRMLIKWARA